MENFLHRTSRIISNKEVAKNIFLLKIKDKNFSKKAKPGNFVLIKIENKTLRRPFSIFDVKKEHFEILYKVVGEGTGILSQKKKNEKIDYIGPLGNSFKILNKKPVFLAGGIGVAGIYFLAKNFPLKGIFIYGTKREKELVDLKLKHRIIKISEEKTKKKVTDFLNLVEKDNVVYVSGPKEMIKEILRKSKRKNVSGYFAWEERMGCGLGLCRSCVIMTKEGYKRTCKEGPVFGFDEVDVENL